MLRRPSVLWLATALSIGWTGATEAQPTPSASRAAAQAVLRELFANRPADPHLIGGESMPDNTNIRLYLQQMFPDQQECRTLLHGEPRLNLPDDNVLLREAYRGLTGVPVGLDWRDVASVERRGNIVSIHRPQSRKAEVNIRFGSEGAAEGVAAAMSFLQASCDDTADAPTSVDHAHRILARALAGTFTWVNEGALALSGRLPPRFRRLFRLVAAEEGGQCFIFLDFRSAGSTLSPESVRFHSNRIRQITRDGATLALTFAGEFQFSREQRTFLTLPNSAEAARVERALEYMKSNPCTRRET